MAEGRKEFSGVPLIRAVIPHRRALPSTPNHHPKALRIKFQCINEGRTGRVGEVQSFHLQQ